MVHVSQVGFHSNKLVKKVRVEKRINDVVNRLNKSKQELYPDLAAERENYDRGIRAVRKAEVQVWFVFLIQVSYQYICKDECSILLLSQFELADCERYFDNISVSVADSAHKKGEVIIGSCYSHSHLLQVAATVASSH